MDENNSENQRDKQKISKKTSSTLFKNKKENNLKRKQKRSRLIVRNLSYKTTENDLREHFKEYGTITDIKLLKRTDGKLVGCAFIQYETVNQAAKAMLKCTNKKFLDREIYIDWSLGKDKYEQINKNDKLNKEEIHEQTENSEKNDNKNEINNNKKDISNSMEDEKNDILIKEETEDEDDEDDDIDESNDNDESENEIEEDSKKQRETKVNNLDDTKDGCTVFLKNVPFDATNDDIKKLCQKFGPIVYAIINSDPISGHSKGTAFVRFKRKECADLLLKQNQINDNSNSMILNGSIIEPFPALSRDEIKKMKGNRNSDIQKDSRSLYLVKEGLIMAGSKAAEGVSASDMAKRHKLEKIKTQILKNLNRFVSRNRLSIHNLPLSYDDDKLRKMVIEYTKLKPHECRVMRENRPSIDHPNGKSKGFGFMSFKTHDNALYALRKLNNNPNVFGQSHRPIVAFSIEDKTVHNIKQKRLLKSQQSNPTYKQKLENSKIKKGNRADDNKNKKITDKKDKTMTKQLKTKINNNDNDNNVENNFIGTSAKPDQFTRMRSDKKIKEQSKEHGKKLSKLKRLMKNKKERLLHLKEKREKSNKTLIKQNNKKKNKSNINKDQFSNLVDKYKKIISSKAEMENVSKKQKRTKWYVE